ncbi:MAG: glutamine-hydrolyzing carbamoyl-phosphate synthase small subunit [Thermoplasmatota archaeon]
MVAQGIEGFLELEDGSRYAGELFGDVKDTDGEVVFNTGMVGYVESLTDPSYYGQILSFSYPLIGNYGVPLNRFESDGIKVRGAVMSNAVEKHSHWESEKGIREWFEESGVVGITGVDTRALTKRLRNRGTMLGRIFQGDAGNFDVADPNATDLVSEVTIKDKVVIEGRGPRIMLVDCGCKESIARELRRRDCTVVRVPYDHELSREDADGVLISNGPGDPQMCSATVDNVRKLMERDVPIGGICLGNQIIALAAGGRTYKLPFGHRSQNQPCEEVGTGHCVITSQNHGFAVDGDRLPAGWEVWYRNLNDGTVEGIKHKERPFISVQFHPEANPGPTDSGDFFDSFLEVVRNGQ